MQPVIVGLSDEYSYLEGACPEGMKAWNMRPIDVRFEVEREEVDFERSPGEEQLKALSHHLEYQASIREVILGAFVSEYAKLIDFDGGYRDELPDQVESIDEMSALLELRYLYVTDRLGESGVNLVGYVFESKLNEEHGMGCLADGCNVVKMGGEEEAW